MLQFVAFALAKVTYLPYLRRMEKSAHNLNRKPLANHFLEWFRSEYSKRREKNENYSIRAFSHYLKISPATISHLLSGKRTPSVKFATKLFTKLEVTPAEKEVILASLIRTGNVPQSTSSADQNYKLIAIDSFKLLSDWYHYAILELTFSNGFTYDCHWIANQLGISLTETRQAIDRLLRLELLKEENGSLVKTEGFVTNGDDVLTSSAHKKLQRHVLQKALDAIDNVDISEKDISSITMAIDESKLPQAKKLITKFRRDMCQFLETGLQTRVFNLGIQLYPVSKGLKNNRSSSL